MMATSISRRKPITLWALGVLAAGLVVVGALQEFGVLPRIFNTEYARKWKSDRIEKERIAAARAQVVELLNAAPRLDVKSLQGAVKTAVAAQQLDVAGFFVFAWQTRYQMDLALWGVTPYRDRQTLFFPNLYGSWANGAKPNVIMQLEEQPTLYVAAINRFLNWEPQFNPAEYPNSESLKASAAEVLQDYRTALQNRKNSYSNPEYARIASAYARAWKTGSSENCRKLEPLMQDVRWKFAPETRWHNRVHLKARDYFDDPDSLALCRAIEADDIEEMERLIAAGVDVNKTGNGGMTALLWAMPDFRLKRFECLLRHGANPNLMLDDDFETIRHPFYLDPELHGEPLIHSGCGPGDSVMLLACQAPIEYLTMVLQHGGNPNAMHPIMNVIPLDLVAVRPPLFDSSDRVALLLEHGADISLVGRQPHLVFRSASEGDYKSTALLLRAGVDPTRHGPEKLKQFKASIASGLKLYAVPRSPEYVERAKYLAEIVAWLKSHGQEIADDALPSTTEKTDRNAKGGSQH